MCHGGMDWRETEGWSELEYVSPETLEQAEVMGRRIVMYGWQQWQLEECAWCKVPGRVGSSGVWCFWD